MIRRATITGLAALTLSVAGSAAPTAWAAGDDPVVRVPSDSPAGAEYSLPLDDARNAGAPKDDGRGAAKTAPKFGTGIGPGSAGTTDTVDATTGTSTSTGTDKSSKSGSSSKTSASTTPAPTSTPAADASSSVTHPPRTGAVVESGGVSPALIGGLSALAFVVLLGGAVVVRRRPG